MTINGKTITEFNDENNQTMEITSQAHPQSEWIREKALAYDLDLSVKTLQARRYKGQPVLPYLKMGGIILYRRSDKEQLASQLIHGNIEI